MCQRGDTLEVIIDDKSISIDSCIAHKVNAINMVGLFKTLGSCCGHGKYPPTIVVKDQSGQTFEYHTRHPIQRMRRFYRKDADGHYFLPERKE